jgi:hypothetical protein
MDAINSILGGMDLDRERPVAFLISVAYPDLWERFVSKCQRENQYPELSPELLNN